MTGYGPDPGHRRGGLRKVHGREPASKLLERALAFTKGGICPEIGTHHRTPHVERGMNVILV